MGVPLVPPWVPDLPPSPEDATGNQPSEDEQSPQETVADTVPPVAPRARFGPARRSLGRFAGDGDVTNMRSALGHYVRRGYGGATTTTQRVGGTVRSAGALFDALSPVIGGQHDEASSQFDILNLSDKSADEILDALVEAVRPIDGTIGRGGLLELRFAMPCRISLTGSLTPTCWHCPMSSGSLP